uniref:Transmembrane protein n=1 Tax=Candidatus Kentrum sp. LFY TaxID=2126342 RepID=A0A450UUF9_9GAMM|nr:MAG: hypothetical protein BECKLFY1418B_GA0070995_10798 [Candidatus Kentron sp. LFY]
MARMEDIGLMSINDTGDASSPSRASNAVLSQRKPRRNAGAWLFWGAFSVLVCAVIFFGIEEPKRSRKQVVETRDVSTASIPASVVASVSSSSTESDKGVTGKKPSDNRELTSYSMPEATVTREVVDTDFGVDTKTGGGVGGRPLVSQAHLDYDGSSFEAVPLVSKKEDIGAQGLPDTKSDPPGAGSQMLARSSAKEVFSVANSVNRSVKIIKGRQAGYGAPLVIIGRTWPQRRFYPYYPVHLGYPTYDPSYIYHPPLAR